MELEILKDIKLTGKVYKPTYCKRKPIFGLGIDLFKISINQDRCRGCGLCIDICDNVFQYAERGPEKVKIREEYRAESPMAEFISKDINCAKRAARACLVDAISIEQCK